MDELEKLRKEKLDRLKERMEGSKMETEIEVDDNSFNEKVVEQSKKVPVLVDFWAPWCAPCNMLSPVLEKLAKEYQGKFVLAKVNVDGARSSAQKFGVMSIPAVKLFKNGQVVDEFVGAKPEESIKEMLNKNL